MLNLSPLTYDYLRGLGMAGAGILMLLLGLRISKCSDRVFNIVSVMAGFVAVLAAVTHFQPVRAWLGNTFDLAGGEGVVAGYALLMLVGAARARTRRAMFVIAASLAFVVILPFAFSSLYWRLFGVEVYYNFPDKDGCIQQTTGITCAPASASMLLQKYGIQVSEGVLAEKAGTNLVGGTSEFALAGVLSSVVSKKGYRADAGYMNYQQARDLGSPFIAYVRLPNIGGHAVLVTSMKSDSVSIIDPLTASPEKISAEEFRDEWTGTAIWIVTKN